MTVFQGEIATDCWAEGADTMGRTLRTCPRRAYISWRFAHRRGILQRHGAQQTTGANVFTLNVHTNGG